jgi:hypothetical protein
LKFGVISKIGVIFQIKGYIQNFESYWKLRSYFKFRVTLEYVGYIRKLRLYRKIGTVVKILRHIQKLISYRKIGVLFLNLVSYSYNGIIFEIWLILFIIKIIYYYIFHR